MTSYAKSNGANARTNRWEDFEEEQPAQRTGSWLPLDALDDEQYVPGPQLRPVTMPQRKGPAPLPPEPVQPTRSHPTRGTQQMENTAARRDPVGMRGIAAKPLAMLAGIAIALAATYVIASSALDWAQIKLDDLQFGRPRTVQMDAYVGHNEAEGIPSHFIGMNLNRRVTVLELPGGDSSKAAAIVGPYLFGEGEDLTPVQLSVQDVNGDAKPDLVVTVKSEQLIYLNDGSTFKLITPEERAALQKTLPAQDGKPVTTPGQPAAPGQGAGK